VVANQNNFIASVSWILSVLFFATVMDFNDFDKRLIQMDVIHSNVTFHRIC